MRLTTACITGFLALTYALCFCFASLSLIVDASCSLFYISEVKYVFFKYEQLLRIKMFLNPPSLPEKPFGFTFPHIFPQLSVNLFSIGAPIYSCTESRRSLYLPLPCSSLSILCYSSSALTFEECKLQGLWCCENLTLFFSINIIFNFIPRCMDQYIIIILTFGHLPTIFKLIPFICFLSEISIIPILCSCLTRITGLLLLQLCN